MRRGFAATVAVPAWARFMTEATAGHKPEWFKPPRDVQRVTICRASGLRASDHCRLAAVQRGDVYDDDFGAGTAPYDHCSVHGAASVP